MRQASVGFQCPECVKSGAAASPSFRGVPSAHNAIVTFVCIGISVAVFLGGSLFDRVAAGDGRTFAQRFALWPPDISHGEWYRIVTSGFMHANLLHLAMNMFALYVVGRVLEPALGHFKFLLVYVVSLFGGGLGVVLLYSAGQGATVGASGAIFGLFGAVLVFQISRGISVTQGVGPLILLNLIITFAIPGISIGGHIGGLVFGVAAGAILLLGQKHRVRNKSEDQLRVAAVVALGVVALVLSFLLAPTLLI
jgi:membrane associated rhomboid family serine protease